MKYYDSTDHDPYTAWKVGQARIPGPPNLTHAELGIDPNNNCVKDFILFADHIELAWNMVHMAGAHYAAWPTRYYHGRSGLRPAEIQGTGPSGSEQSYRGSSPCAHSADAHRYSQHTRHCGQPISTITMPKRHLPDTGLMN